jgi:hypothetical protein
LFERENREKIPLRKYKRLGDKIKNDCNTIDTKKNINIEKKRKRK